MGDGSFYTAPMHNLTTHLALCSFFDISVYLLDELLRAKHVK